MEESSNGSRIGHVTLDFQQGKVGSLQVKEGDSVDGQDLVCKIVK